VAFVACDDPAPAPATAPEPERPPPTEPPAPPQPPSLASIGMPTPGNARAIYPVWNEARSWFEHQTRDAPARLGRSEDVTQVLVGTDGTDGILITFYGRDLARGEYPVLPGTDETRRERAGRDDDVFTLVLTRPGVEDLRSLSGVVEILELDDTVVGAADVDVRSAIHSIDTPLRVRFHAAPDPRLDAALEQEAAIRDQFRRRHLR